MTTAEQAEADYAKAAAQLKAAHGKEDAALKAEETEKTAALKAEHAATASNTGFLSKLTGHQDPVQKAESQHLKAEINRANQQTKAAHTSEKAELDAAKQKEVAAAQAADSLLRNNAGHNNAGGYNNAGYNNAGGFNNAAGAAYNNAGGSYAPSNYNAAPGAHVNPNVLGSAAPGPLTDADKRIFNHATGSYGQAALADGQRQDAGIHHSGQAAQQQFVPQGIAAVPVMVMTPQQPVMMGTQQPMMGTQQPMMGTQQPLGTQQPMMGTQQPMMGAQQPLGTQHGHFSR